MQNNNTVDISKRTGGEWKSVKAESASNVWTFIASKKNKNEYIGLFSAEVLRPALMKEAIEKGEANAAFIVTACNNYDKLVEELKDIKNLAEALENEIFINDDGTNEMFRDAWESRINNARQLLKSIEENI